MPDERFKILVIDENRIRASIIEDGLKEAGYGDVVTITEVGRLMRDIVEIDPDVIFIDLGNPNRDRLEAAFQMSKAARRPIAMFVDSSDADSIGAAVDAGVSAYVVDGLRKERVKPILDLAILRFNAFYRLQRELEETRTALAERKVIDRAKGILMKSKAISEDDAYALLRKTAMRQNRKIADVAESLVLAAGLLD
ncbi:MAG: response regulator with putative antiterminator output domain [Hyphomicrobiales bacterium]|nr:response regulator with putative antiterminator output domain [Hyphomicrobiales bacterium]